MARGLPAAWSALFGLPLIAAGAYVYGFQTQYPLVANQPAAPPEAGLPLAAFGAFVLALGLYVQFVAAPEAPRMREGERLVDERQPAQQGALARTFASVPFLAAGIDLLYFTDYPYVYPTVALAVGLYLFSTGIHRYWQNTLTTYFLTDQRVLEEYRFVSLVRNEVPLDAVRAVEERRSPLDSLLRLGSVNVRSGATDELSVTVADVRDAGGFADAIRERQAGEATGRAGAPDGGADGNADGGH
jgi:membrane protein YdbS with pleckstrin-like domain